MTHTKLPDDWKKEAVGNICASIVPGRNKPKKFDGDIPWVNTPDLLNRYIPNDHHSLYVSNSELRLCGGKIVPPQSIVMSCVGELGIVAITTRPIVINQQLHAYICSNKVYNEFLAYALVMQKNYMLSIASVTTIPYLNKTNCESIPILLPPLPEQKAIAEILSTWDRGIQQLTSLLKAKHERKAALMQRLLTGKLRLPEFAGQEWKEVTLCKLAIVVMGSSPQSSAYNNLGKGLPLLQGNTDIKNRLSAPRVHTSQITKECKVDDILLSVRAPVGTISRSIHYACIGRGIAAIRAKENISQSYLYQWLLYYEPKWISLSQGSTFESVNGSDIKSLHITIPVYPEQQIRIADILSAADREITQLEQKLDAIREQKKGLMQQLLTGKKRVNI